MAILSKTSMKARELIGDSLIRDRLDYLRKQIEQENMSYGELAELQSLADHIPAGDNLLLESAGVPEFN